MCFLIRGKAKNDKWWKLQVSFDTSAGLDLTEFYQKDRSHVSEFWKTVQDMWHTFYTTGLPVASCISGHCPAGGLIVASCSDYRVMQRGKFTIGLNEVRMVVFNYTGVQGWSKRWGPRFA